MLLNFLHCTEQLPTKKNYLARIVISAEVKKPWPTLNEVEAPELSMQSTEERIGRILEVDI